MKPGGGNPSGVAVAVLVAVPVDVIVAVSVADCHGIAEGGALHGADMLAVCEAMLVLEGDALHCTEYEGVAVPVVVLAELETLAEMDGDADTVAFDDTVTVTFAETDGDADTVAFDDAVTVTFAETDGDADTVAFDDAVTVTFAEGEAEGDTEYVALEDAYETYGSSSSGVVSFGIVALRFASSMQYAACDTSSAISNEEVLADSALSAASPLAASAMPIDTFAAVDDASAASTNACASGSPLAASKAPYMAVVALPYASIAIAASSLAMPLLKAASTAAAKAMA